MNKDQQNELVEDLSEVLQVRRDKLAKLQEMGRDPFHQSRYDRTSKFYGYKKQLRWNGRKNS